jgi:cysteinyl-tRNA synthetase
MSKSLGNFFTIHDLLKDWPGEVLRFNMLQTHYRQPINWTERGLRVSKTLLNRWYDLIGDVPPFEQPASAFLSAKFDHVLFDDLNTPGAFSRLHGMAAILDEKKNPTRAERAEFKTAANFLGLLESTATAWFGSPKLDSGLKAKIAALVQARDAARAAKNFAESDRIRDELAAMGVVLKDSKDGTTWEIAR